MPPPVVAVSLRSYKQPFRRALQTASRMGVTAVEIDARHDVRPTDMSQTALRELRKLLDDLNLKVSAVSFQTRRGYDNPDQLDARVEATRQAITLAYQLGTPNVVNQVGRVPESSEGREWKLLVEVLTDLGRFGDRTGAWRLARTGTESGADLRRLLDSVPEGSIGVDFDPGGLIINSFSPQEVIEQLGTEIRHVHARDGVRDLARGRGVEVPLGRGSADFPELLAMLEERDYRGYVTIERGESDDPEWEVQQAIKYLQNLYH